MARKRREENLLDKVPVRTREWLEERKEDGDSKGETTVKIKIPRFNSRAGKRFCLWIKKSPTYGINLDAIGSEAWRLCDGNNTVRYIADSLHEKFEEEVEPAYERVCELMGIMEMNGLITYKNVKDNNDDKEEK
jgi:hypothetical protein